MAKKFGVGTKTLDRYKALVEDESKADILDKVHQHGLPIKVAYYEAFPEKKRENGEANQSKPGKAKAQPKQKEAPKAVAKDGATQEDEPAKTGQGALDSIVSEDKETSSEKSTEAHQEPPETIGGECDATAAFVLLDTEREVRDQLASGNGGTIVVAFDMDTDEMSFIVFDQEVDEAPKYIICSGLEVAQKAQEIIASPMAV